MATLVIFRRALLHPFVRRVSARSWKLAEAVGPPRTKMFLRGQAKDVRSFASVSRVKFNSLLCTARREWRTLLWPLALLPAFLIALLIWQYGVDVPQWDEWEIAGLFQKFARGTLSLGDLFAQQNEYRQLFPNLLFIGLGWLTKWDVRYEMLVSFLLACLISLNVYRLSKLTIAGDRRQLWWLYLSANLLIFSSVQNENWLQGQQVIYFVPVACVTTALLAAYSARLRLTGKFLICAILSLVSTFSSANGLLCWLVLLPVLAWSSRDHRLSHRKWLLLGWLAGFALSFSIYFYHFKSPLGPSQQSEVLNHFGRASLFFLSLLGAPFGLGKLAIAVPIGLLFLLLFAYMCRSFLHSWSDPAVVRSMLGWLMLASYSVMTAVLITIGRLGFGLQYALQNRYTTFTLYLPVALVYLTPRLISTSRWRIAKNLRLARLAPLLAMLLVFLQLPNYLKELRYANVLRLTLLQGKACILYGNIVRDDCAVPLYRPRAADLQKQANVLDELGFLRPPLARSDRLHDIEGATPLSYGSFVQLVEVATDEYVASGWAMLPGRGEPPDVVLLAYENSENQASLFAIATLDTQRDFVSALMRRGIYGDKSWSKSFSASRLPANAVKLSAWAFDAYTGKAYRIEGTHLIRKASRAASGF